LSRQRSNWQHKSGMASFDQVRSSCHKLRSKANKTRQMYNAGHQVASHTWSHPDLCNITSAQRKNEMYKNEMALRNILGVIPTYMRPPYSSCTAACGCEADLEELGYHITYFVLRPLPSSAHHFSFYQLTISGPWHPRLPQRQPNSHPKLQKYIRFLPRRQIPFDRWLPSHQPWHP